MDEYNLKKLKELEERKEKTVKEIKSIKNKIDSTNQENKFELNKLKRESEYLMKNLSSIENLTKKIKSEMKCAFCKKSLEHSNFQQYQKRFYCMECYNKMKKNHLPHKKENTLVRFWNFLKEDSWQSWIVSMVLLVVFIKFIFFPTLSFVTGTKLPLVVVESCSMYHDSSFNIWWTENGPWYESRNIKKSEFINYSLKNGLNKGDIVIAIGKKEYKKGDVIIFNAGATYPLIHRIVTISPTGTKGDNNPGQILPNTLSRVDETNIAQDQIIGKAIARVPYLGWIKLIFFEPFKSPDKRGLCS